MKFLEGLWLFCKDSKKPCVIYEGRGTVSDSQLFTPCPRWPRPRAARPPLAPPLPLLRVPARPRGVCGLSTVYGCISRPSMAQTTKTPELQRYPPGPERVGVSTHECILILFTQSARLGRYR